MPVAGKSLLTPFLGFMALGLTYTTIVASKEGATIDAARTRWQDQRGRAEAVRHEIGRQMTE